MTDPIQPSPSLPETPATPGAARLSDSLAAEIDEAMAAMVGEAHQRRAPSPQGQQGSQRQHKPAAPRPAHPSAPSIPGAKPAIRGPRRVESGREHRPGKVVSVGPEDVFIEFGPKELGVASRRQWTEDNLPKQGDTIEVIVERFNANEQLYVCTRPGAIVKAAWEMLEPGQTVEAVITGVNKGGLECEIANHRAFIPASQVDVRRIDDLSQFVGQKLACRISRIERAGMGNIVLSRREVLDAQREEHRQALKESLKEGQTVTGVVTRLADFGAFVDIGGVDGLVHISDLSHDRIRRTQDVVQVGQSVSCRVLKIDWEKGRISLGLKQAMEDPFRVAAGGIVAGAEVTGRVTKILEFGAFVEVAPGVEGLVHISELSWRRVATVDSVLKQDQVIAVKVLEVDEGKRRISLSLKQMTEQPAPEPRPGGRGGRGERGERDTRTPEEILKETPELRRMREEFKKKAKGEGLKSGLGGGPGVDLGKGLGSLRLGG